MAFKNSYQRLLGMPSRSKILQYWQENASRLGAIGIEGDEWGVEEKECFACGNCLVPLERAHVIASIAGGSNDLENLHLLCRGCHSQSASVKDYWAWLHYMRKNKWKYPIYHLIDVIEAHGYDLKQMAQHCEDNQFNDEQLNEYIQEVFKKCFS